MAGEGTITTAKWKQASGGTYAAVGLLTGGNHGVKGTWEAVNGAGGEVGAYVGDMVCEPQLTGDITNITLGMLAKCLRTGYPKTGLPLDLYVQAGTDVKGWEIANCGCNRMHLSWKYPGRWTFDVGLVGLAPTIQASGITAAAIPATDTFFDQAHTTCLLNSAAYQVLAIDAQWDNVLKATGDGDGRGVAAKHLSTLLEYGIEKPTLKVTVRKPLGVALAADSPGRSATFSCIINNATASTLKGFTIAGTGLAVMSEVADLRAEENGYVPTVIEYFCTPGTVLLTTQSS